MQVAVSISTGWPGVVTSKHTASSLSKSSSLEYRQFRNRDRSCCTSLSLTGRSYCWLLSFCSNLHSFIAQSCLMSGFCAIVLSNLETDIGTESTRVKESSTARKRVHLDSDQIFLDSFVATPPLRTIWWILLHLEKDTRIVQITRTWKVFVLCYLLVICEELSLLRKIFRGTVISGFVL